MLYVSSKQVVHCSQIKHIIQRQTLAVEFDENE